jgi:DNA-binding Xre family transcriptional regulator
MQRKGIRTVSELQRMTNLSRRTLDKYFHNDSKQINHDSALTLCEALECDFKELFKLVEQNEYDEYMASLEKYREYLDSGFVYFIKHNLLDITKIGKASDLEVRFKQLKREYGEGLEIIHAIKTDKSIELEKYYHSMFKSKREKGEWFNLSVEDLEFLKK